MTSIPSAHTIRCRKFLRTLSSCGRNGIELYFLIRRANISPNFSICALCFLSTAIEWNDSVQRSPRMAIIRAYFYHSCHGIVFTASRSQLRASTDTKITMKKVFLLNFMGRKVNTNEIKNKTNNSHILYSVTSAFRREVTFWIIKKAHKFRKYSNIYAYIFVYSEALHIIQIQIDASIEDWLK